MLENYAFYYPFYFFIYLANIYMCLLCGDTDFPLFTPRVLKVRETQWDLPATGSLLKCLQESEELGQAEARNQEPHVVLLHAEPSPAAF